MQIEFSARRKSLMEWKFWVNMFTEWNCRNMWCDGELTETADLTVSYVKYCNKVIVLSASLYNSLQINRGAFRCVWWFNVLQNDTVYNFVCLLNCFVEWLLATVNYEKFKCYISSLDWWWQGTPVPILCAYLAYRGQ